jgi:hypothetical protein
LGLETQDLASSAVKVNETSVKEEEERLDDVESLMRKGNTMKLEIFGTFCEQ